MCWYWQLCDFRIILTFFLHFSYALSLNEYVSPIHKILQLRDVW